MSLKDRIREAREHAGMTQEDLARAAGIGKRSVVDYEAGRPPKADTLIEIAEVTGKPLSFFGGPNPKKATEVGGDAEDVLGLSPVPTLAPGVENGDLSPQPPTALTPTSGAADDGNDPPEVREARLHYLGRAFSAREPSYIEASDMHRLAAQAHALPYTTFIAVDEQLRYQRLEGDLHIFRLAGYDPEEIMGRSVRDVLKPHHAAVLMPLYRAALDGVAQVVTQTYGGVAFVGQFLPCRSPDGERHAACIAQPIEAAYGDRGMRTRSEAPVLVMEGDFNAEFYVGMRTSEPRRIGARLPGA